MDILRMLDVNLKKVVIFEKDIVLEMNSKYSLIFKQKIDALRSLRFF